MTDTSESKTMRAGSRTYFFDVKQTSKGKDYLVITESRFKGEGKKHERQRINVFPEDAPDFLDVVTEMIEKL